MSPSSVAATTAPTTDDTALSETAASADASNGDGDPTAYTPAAAYTTSNKWTMPRHARYENHLCYLVVFVHRRGLLGARYPKGTTFTRDQLLQIKL